MDRAENLCRDSAPGIWSQVPSSEGCATGSQIVRLARWTCQSYAVRGPARREEWVSCRPAGRQPGFPHFGTVRHNPLLNCLAVPTAKDGHSPPPPSMRRSGRQGWAGQVRGPIGCVWIDRQPLDLRVRGPAHRRRSGVARGLVAAESGPSQAFSRSNCLRRALRAAVGGNRTSRALSCIAALSAAAACSAASNEDDICASEESEGGKHISGARAEIPGKAMLYRQNETPYGPDKKRKPQDKFHRSSLPLLTRPPQSRTPAARFLAQDDVASCDRAGSYMRADPVVPTRGACVATGAEPGGMPLVPVQSCGQWTSPSIP